MAFATHLVGTAGEKVSKSKKGAADESEATKAAMVIFQKPTGLRPERPGRASLRDSGKCVWWNGLWNGL
jgi:hypothetical protein